MLSSFRVWKGEVPNHSTLVKFSKRVDTNVMGRILRSLAHILCSMDMTAAVDSTGFSCSNASGHYVKRIMEMNRLAGREITYSNAAVRGFSEVSLAVDTSTKTIPACDCVDSNHADVKRMEYVVDDLAEGGFGISYVVADKGHDAEYVHMNIRERLHARTMIPVRKMAKPSKGSTTKKARWSKLGRMRHHFDKEIR